jgi:hypothetical protein
LCLASLQFQLFAILGLARSILGEGKHRQKNQ